MVGLPGSDLDMFALSLQDEDVIGAGGCTSIGSASLVENQKHNEGISWGVDDLDRRRHLVMERCTVAGKTFACVRNPTLISGDTTRSHRPSPAAVFFSLPLHQCVL